MKSLTLSFCLILANFAFSAEKITKGEQLFVLKVKPLLEQKCLNCHGKGKRLRGGLDLTSKAGLLKGGDSGKKLIIPGRGNKSLLYLMTTWSGPDFEMPPKESDRLSKEQTWLIRDWINEGAPWPDERRSLAIRQAHVEEQKRGVRVETSGGLSETWTNRLYQPENLWAYQPLKKPSIPRVEVEHPVDAFIMRKLNQLKISPGPRAERRTLIRRATYDLLGLPPTPEEIQEFANDPASDREAFSRLIDRLLASPAYGEQWGRHWLDVTRYADSAGFANDYERPNGWRYRDYVVRSLNRDKPYDEFIREQIAGDEIDPKDPEKLIAVGFLRMGPWEHTGMSVGKITRQFFLDDVTDIVGQVFLSHPLQCARCHDHKFDPIPTKDYYRVQSVFATTQFADRDAAFLPSENRHHFEQEREQIQKRIRHYQAIQRAIAQKTLKAEREWYAKRGLKYAPRNQLRKRGVPESKIAPRHLGLSTKDFGMERIARKNLIRLRWELDAFRPIAYSVYSGKTPRFRNVSSRIVPPKNRNFGQLEQTAILTGGDPFSPSKKVVPGVLSMAGEKKLPTTIQRRRLELANWVADAKNPLTARSIVNRIWQHHFGQGLAKNPNNFGAMGKKPTHPELLDWLAVKFLDGGWSMKRLHKLIMTSEAWCRSSRKPTQEKLQNYAVAPVRRLSAEEIRDTMLAVSGELNLEVGGLPVRPEINLEAALQPRQIMGTYAPAYQPSRLPEQRHRRSLYAVRIRGLRNPFFEVHNQPGFDKSCELRERSTVTPQIFAMFNNQGSHDRALALASRAMSE